jgi:hypothetical protein
MHSGSGRAGLILPRYGIDTFHDVPSGDIGGCGPMRASAVEAEPAEWNDVAREFGVTDILTYPGGSAPVARAAAITFSIAFDDPVAHRPALTRWKPPIPLRTRIPLPNGSRYRSAQKTPLNARHRARCAHGAVRRWEMPVEYAGIVSEHMAVRTSAGLSM